MKKSAIYSLVLANLVPLSGIFFLKWDLFSILFFYWLESAVVGAYNIPRMLMARAISLDDSGRPIHHVHRTSGIIFFFLHYSGFMAGHGAFLWAIFGPVSIKTSTVVLGLVSLTLSHGVSFVTNFIGRKEYEKVNFSQQMMAPYRRIFVMHITIMICAFLLNLLSNSQIILIILVVLKISIDLVAHIREHKSYSTYVTPRFFSGRT